MTTVNGGLGISSGSNSSQFQPFGRSMFSASGVSQASLQIQNQELFIQKQALQNDTLKRETTSESTSPVSNGYYPDYHNVSQSSPEKSADSQTPPSPADSGVVEDSKLEDGNMLQNLIPNLDKCKLDDGLAFGGCSKTSASGASFKTSTPVPGDHVLGFQVEDVTNPSINSFGLSTCNNSFVSDQGGSSNISTQLSENNSVAISQSLAAIWSCPTPPAPTQDSLTTPDIDDIISQALQQQQLNGWPSPSTDKHDRIPSNPPPGLHNPPFFEKQAQQQQNAPTHLQSVRQQQMLHRRSQSVVVTRPSLANRSLSQQPGYVGGLSNMNQMKMDGLFSNSRNPSWGNGQVPHPNAWPSGSGKSASLFNSLQLSSGSNRSLHDPSAFRKQSLSSQMTHPPLLNRSISTPAKHSSYMNGQAFPTSLNDNPFFQRSDTSTSSGFASFENKDSMGFASLESQLYDIIKSSDHPLAAAHSLSRPNGKWGDLAGDGMFEKTSTNHLPSNMIHGVAPFFGDCPIEKYSRKVFVGGLPPDIAEDEIRASFRQFGPLVVDWPHKAESKSFFPPKGYAFLLFQEELSVQALISCCLRDGDKLYLKVSSPTIREKPVQIRPWVLSDSDFVLDGSQPLDPRKTIFVGGVPRPLRAVELAMIMDRLYGGVCYAGIDVDPELKYPKGAGRVAFSNQHSYIAAISARFVQLQHGDIDKRVEVKPYVLDDQHCDECQGSRCGGKFAPFFCANVACLQYYCENCWAVIHAMPGRELHKPLLKEGADRTPRSMLYRW